MRENSWHPQSNIHLPPNQGISYLGSMNNIRIATCSRYRTTQQSQVSLQADPFARLLPWDQNNNEVPYKLAFPDYLRATATIWDRTNGPLHPSTSLLTLHILCLLSTPFIGPFHPRFDHGRHHLKIELPSDLLIQWLYIDRHLLPRLLTFGNQLYLCCLRDVADMWPVGLSFLPNHTPPTISIQFRQLPWDRFISSPTCTYWISQPRF